MVNYSVSWSSSRSAAANLPDDPLARALAAHRTGNLEMAIAHAVAALRARPNRALASYNLGVALGAAGYALAAVPFLERAVLLRPGSAVLLEGLVFALFAAGQAGRVGAIIDRGEAAGCPAPMLERLRGILAEAAGGAAGASAAGDPAALGLKEPAPAALRHELPDAPLALTTRTLAQDRFEREFPAAMRHYQSGAPAQAVAILEPLLVQLPSWGEGHHILGLARLAQGEVAAALQALRRASELLPGRAELWDHLALASRQAGAGERLETMLRGLALDPLRAESWNNAADAALADGQPHWGFQAAVLARRLDLGLMTVPRLLLRSAGQLDAGVRGEAPGTVEPGPFMTEALARLTAGITAPEAGYALVDDLVLAGQHQAVVELLGPLYREHGNRPPELLAELLFNQRHLCDWRDLEGREREFVTLIRSSEESVTRSFMAMALADLAPADLLRVARLEARQFDAITPLAAGGVARAPGRLRIGYLSGDLQGHATAYLTAGIFEHHDRDRFEVFAYSTTADDGGPMRQRLRRAFEHFVDIETLEDEQAARRIRADGIDILIDLKGYTRGHRLGILAYRPAPLQVTWLGFPGGTGAEFVDYLIADPVVVPPERAGDYAEALAWLPDAYAPVDDRREITAPPTRVQAGLPEDGFVFCCFNDVYKITPEVFALWCRLLAAVPDSVLWLFVKNRQALENLRQEMRGHGIEPARLIAAPRLPQAEHLARIGLADLFLDTWPINAHTTASDALCAGLPVLTRPGETFASRVAASLLTAAGLPELVAANSAEYHDGALRLARNPSELTQLRCRLVEARATAPYFATEGFTRHLESLYERMARRREQGLDPAQLDPCRMLERGR